MRNIQGSTQIFQLKYGELVSLNPHIRSSIQTFASFSTVCSIFFFETSPVLQ